MPTLDIIRARLTSLIVKLIEEVRTHPVLFRAFSKKSARNPGKGEM
jgi:hypothetical protein